MDALDWTTIAIYAALIFVYSSKIASRRGAAAVAGFSTLVLAKKYEDSRPELAERMKMAGYGILIFSPSYDHWYDVLGALGYTAMAFGNDIIGEPPTAVYDLFAAMGATSPLYMAARAGLAVAIALDIESPLMPSNKKPGH
jgi:hypothetical protein